MDIMRSSFFRGISWENILARVQDGPMVPQQVHYGSSSPEATGIAGAGTPNGKDCCYLSYGGYDWMPLVLVGE